MFCAITLVLFLQFKKKKEFFHYLDIFEDGDAQLFLRSLVPFRYFFLAQNMKLI